MTNTKAVSLTEDEIMQLVEYHGRNVADNFTDRIERLGYLHKRLKSFKEPEEVKQDTAANAAVKGWGSSA